MQFHIDTFVGGSDPECRLSYDLNVFCATLKSIINRSVALTPDI